MDERWQAYRAALSGSPGQTLDAKEMKRREDARARVTYTPFQSKQFTTGGYDKKIYQPKDFSGVKTFRTKDFQTKQATFSEKAYSTKIVDRKIVAQKNYTPPSSPGYATKTYPTEKVGLRTLAELQGKSIDTKTQSYKSLISGDAGKPATGREAVKPKPILDKKLTGDPSPNEK